SQLFQELGLAMRRDAGVDLDRDLGAWLECEPIRESAPDAPHLIDIEIRRRAAAPVVLDDASPFAETHGDERDLALEVVQIGIRHAGLLRDDDVASAERAALAAEGKMDVERERFLRKARGLIQLLEVTLRREALREFDRGWIGRVTGSRAVIFREKI